MKKSIILIIAALLVLASCSDFTPKAPYEYADDGTWEGIFSGFWHGMNENYVFWNVDDTDWDGVYRKYMPLFRDLGEYDNEDTSEDAARYFYDIVSGLSDGHLSVTVNLKNSMFEGEVEKFSIAPGYIRLAKQNGKTDEAIFEAIYGNNEFGSNLLQLLPPEVMRENTRNILSYVYGLRFTKGTGSEIRDEILSHSDYTNSEGKTVLLYSNGHASGETVSKDWGKVKYYPVSDVLGDNPSINDCFSSWTLMIVLSTSRSSSDKNAYSTTIESMAFAGITKNHGNTIPGIVYTTFSNFMFAGLIRSDYTKAGTYGYLSDFHDYKADPSVKGLVVDVRGNTGGYNLDREYLFGDIMKEKHQFGYQRSKMGYNRLDFSALLPVYIYPEAGNLQAIYGSSDATHLYDKPFAVITNCYSVSNAEMAAFLAKSMPKGCQIGGTTFGAQGTLAGDYLDMNAGSFTVGDYISQVYTPFAQVVDINGVSHEGKGCVPDIEVPFNKDDFEDGTDSRLQSAFDWVKSAIED